MSYVTYSSNNSGGNWWLTDEDWINLEKAGWEVEWGTYDNRFPSRDAMTEKDRWLGCLAKEATRRGLTLHEAVDEWERITGKSSTDAGCPCCGQPHYFSEYTDDKKFVKSGPEISYEARW